MPTYEWKCTAPQDKEDPTPCGREHVIIRKHTEYRVPPEECSLCGNTDPERWEKFIGAPPGEQYGWRWGGGKGNWLLLLLPVSQFAYEILTGGIY